jgi:hypothetical protein
MTSLKNKVARTELANSKREKQNLTVEEKLLPSSQR